ncbi:hypothetical protein JCM8547_008112 [Rhodosporidiobolus lusitaniae]
MLAAPRFAFSYNPDDADLAPLPSCTQRQLTAVVPPRNPYDGEDDDFIPYGPTTHRRGRMRFVPATGMSTGGVAEGGVGVLPATIETKGEEEHRVDRKGKGKAADQDEKDEVKKEDEEEKPVEVERKKGKLAGSSVRGLYESIVGLGSKPASRAASPPPTSLRSGIGSRRPSPPPPSVPPPASAAAPSASTSSAPLPSARVEADVIVLSSDSEPDESGPSSSSWLRKRPRRRSPAPLHPAAFTSAVNPPSQPQPASPPAEAEADDDDLIVLSPTTGLPVPPLPHRPSSFASSSSAAPVRSFSFNSPPASARPSPLQIHQLLPPSSAPPVSLPTHYGLKSDNKGWRLLEAQGWKEGAALGPQAPPAGEGEPNGAGGGGGERRGLLVPLRPIEKHDRLGLGSLGTSKEAWRRLTPAERVAEREAKEEEERRAMEKRGRGARGMKRVREKEMRERKAWIAYMNR